MPKWDRFFNFCFPKKIQIISHEEEEYTCLILSGLAPEIQLEMGDVKTKKKEQGKSKEGISKSTP